MASTSAYIDPFTIAAATYSSGAYKWNSVSKEFSFALPASGIIITSAKLYVGTDNRGSVEVYKTVNGGEISKNAYGNHYSTPLDITEFFGNTNSIWTAGSIKINFRYKASSNQVNHISGGSSYYTDIELRLNYDLPYSKCTAPTTVKISKSTASFGESVKLSWSGAKAGNNMSISGYRIYRSTSLNGTYSSLATTTSTSHNVTAPSSAGAYYYRVMALSSYDSDYNSDRSTAYASVACSVTAPSVPTGLSMSPSSKYPDGTATLTWSAASAGTNNPITKYSVYRSEDGSTYSLLGSTTSRSYTVTAAQRGTLYFKVKTIGTYSDSNLSSAVTLATDLTETALFEPDSDSVVAGESASITIATNVDKVHTLTVSIGSYSTVVTGASGEDTISFDTSLSWLNAIPNASSGTLTLALQTDGAGTLRHTMTLTCPDSAAPTGVSATVAPNSDSVPAAWGIYAQVLSSAIFTVPAAAAQYGATIKKYAVQGNNISATSTEPFSTESENFSGFGTHTYTITATDSRGKSTSTTLTIDVQPYNNPTFINAFYARALSTGAEDDEGTYGLCKGKIVYSSLGGNNSATCKVEWQLPGGAWTDEGNMGANPDQTDTAYPAYLLIGNDTLDTANNYNVRFTVTDAVGNVNQYQYVIQRSQWELHIASGGGAWAFGGVADRPGDLHVWGGLKLDTPLHIASGGTGADTKSGAKAALDIDDLEDALGNARFVNKTISGSNGTAAYTFTSNCAFIIFISGSAAGLRSVIWGYCTAAGAITVSQTNATSSTSISTTTATDKLTIKNAGSNACYATLMRLTGTAPT